MKRPIELLAPARNLECGMAAIDHGADAVYIGAPRFGARAAAGNTLDDIRRLCDYAHPFGVRIYVTVNTILYDDELPAVERLVWDLWRIGVDALIVQDLALLRLHLPPIALHASTQMDNRTPQKVLSLHHLGYRRTVLARELSLADIAAVHAAVPAMELEVFVHGALCVSYSGQCYASQYCFGRSANRGECAQFCRLPFTLQDADGHVLARDRHLLSLRDMNRSDALEELVDAGATSFKIEGRLKDVSYVKNITAYYRRRLDDILRRRPDCCRASVGRHTYTFTPNPQKSFNRGFTEYFLRGRTDDVWSFATPKSMGEPVSVRDLQNGDGVCWLDRNGDLQGMRVDNAATFRAPAGVRLYRNYDIAFERLLARPSATRRIPVVVTLHEIPWGFVLSVQPSVDGPSTPASRGVTLAFPYQKQTARTPQSDNIRTQLSRLGGTILEADAVHVELTAQWFIPSSVLADWRRQAVDAFVRTCTLHRCTVAPRRPLPPSQPLTLWTDADAPASYRANIANREASSFCRQQTGQDAAPAFELRQPTQGTLMYCRHCLRYAFGLCPRQRREGQGGSVPPLVLVLGDGRRFPLHFDCRQCLMEVRYDAHTTR